MSPLYAAARLMLAAVTFMAALGCGDAPSATTEQSESSQPAKQVSPPGWTTYEDRSWGYTVAYPHGWHRAVQGRRAGDPIVILSLASFPLRQDDAAYPIPRQGFDADEAFVTIQERGLDPESDWRTFPPRPAHFQFEPGQGSVPADYVRRGSGIRFADHWFGFTDSGRHFHVQVAIGESVPDPLKTEPYRILDTLRFDPAVKPDWPSAG